MVRAYWGKVSYVSACVGERLWGELGKVVGISFVLIGKWVEMSFNWKWVEIIFSKWEMFSLMRNGSKFSF